MVGVVPSPPPSWPTITREVGTLLGVVLVVGKVRLLVRLMVKLVAAPL
jgi:hypothetical protein